MARLAVNRIGSSAALRIAGRFRGVPRRIGAIESSRLAPAGADLLGDYVDLLGGQHSAGALREARHGGSPHAVSDDIANRVIVRNGEIDWIGECDCCAAAAILAVTCGAIGGVERSELEDLIGRQRLGVTMRLAVRRSASGEQQRSEYQEWGYRMALDHPKSVVRLAVFDVIPILEAWGRSDARFAQTYWPWVLLSQKEPLPEKYLLGAPEAVFHNQFGQGSFGKQVLREYVSTYRDPARVHGICEEYRAAATIDVEHDRADKEASKQIECPMLHLWAEGGPLDTFYTKDGGSLGVWRRWAPRAEGQAMKGGHFFPEENPDDTAAVVSRFLNA
jgi:hypothetical protein